MPDDQLIATLTDIRDRLARVEERAVEAAVQATTAATEAREAKDHSARHNGRMSRLESRVRDMEAQIQIWTGRAEVAATVLVTKAQGKRALTVISLALTAIGLLSGIYVGRETL